MNPRDVPDDVYVALADAAAASCQSLSVYVVERLTEIAQTAQVADCLASYQPPLGSGLTLEDASAAVRAIRETQ